MAGVTHNSHGQTIIRRGDGSPLAVFSCSNAAGNAFRREVVTKVDKFVIRIGSFVAIIVIRHFDSRSMVAHATAAGWQWPTAHIF